MKRRSHYLEVLWRQARPVEWPELYDAACLSPAGEEQPDEGQEQAALPSREEFLQELQLLRQEMLVSVDKERQQVLENARTAAAQEIAERKQQGYEQGLAEGREAGQRDGHAQGFAEGYQRGTERIAAEQDRLLELIACLDNPMRLLTQQLEALLGDVIQDMVLAIVRRELSQDSTSAITNGLQVLRGMVPPNQHQLHLVAHPQDVALIRQALQGHGLLVDEQGSVEIIPDQELDPGGLRLESDFNVLDLSIRSQLEALYEKALGVA